MSLKDLLEELKKAAVTGEISESLVDAIEKKTKENGGLVLESLKSLDGLVIPRPVGDHFEYGGINDKQEPEGLNLDNLTSLDGLRISERVGDHFEYRGTNDEREQGEKGSRLGH